MKILVINGSPKGEKSNSLRLTNAFCEGLREEIEENNKRIFKESNEDIRKDINWEKGEVVSAEIENLSVYQMEIHDCRGCFACWKNTSGKCVIQDDMSKVIEKIRNADIIIWSFPLYYFGLPSKLKALMDRLLPMNLPFMSNEAENGGHPGRYDMSGKRYVIISTCGFYTAQGNYTGVDAQFEHIYGKNQYTSIYCGQGELFRVPELRKRTDEYLAYVRQAGKEFVFGEIQADTRMHLSELLYPRKVFEAMADASWGLEMPIEDSNKKKKEACNNGQNQAYFFTKQMAALYNPASWNQKDKVLEFQYTDVGQSCQVIMKKDQCEVVKGTPYSFTTRIITPLEIWMKIGKGELEGQKALMEHMYRVEGDFELMIHWDDYFGDSAVQKQSRSNVSSQKTEENKKTNMNLMLLPWIIIWVAISINARIGGIIGILTCAVLPFAFLKFRPVIFEYLSIFAVSVVSLLSVLGIFGNIVIPVSYLFFGVMWSVTVFCKIPLTAYYSMNDYGEEDAWENPLFIRTNRILTACWGILYLVTPIWTVVIMQTKAAPWTGAINSLLPAVMGVFTVWFQRWYPAYYAKKR